MDTEITKLIQALRGISNKLEEIYGKPGETKENTEKSEPQVQALSDRPTVQELSLPATVPNTVAPQPFDTSTFNPMLPSGSFEVAPMDNQVIPQVETDADKIRRLEAELQQVRHQNINFNFAPTAIGGTYGKSNY
jgi:hypothetical protein